MKLLKGCDPQRGGLWERRGIQGQASGRSSNLVSLTWTERRSPRASAARLEVSRLPLLHLLMLLEFGIATRVCPLSEMLGLWSFHIRISAWPLLNDGQKFKNTPESDFFSLCGILTSPPILVHPCYAYVLPVSYIPSPRNLKISLFHFICMGVLPICISLCHVPADSCELVCGC